MILDSIFEMAARDPARLALIYNDRTLSYGDFAGAIAAAEAVVAGQEIGGPGVAILAMGNLLDGWIWSLALRHRGLTTMVARSLDDMVGAVLPSVRCVVASADEPWPGLDRHCQSQGWRLVSGKRDLPTSVGRPQRSHRPPGGHVLQTSATTGAYKKVLIDPVFEDAFMRQRQVVFGITGASMVSVFDFGLWTGVGYKTAVSAWMVGGAVIINQGRATHLALEHPRITHATVIPQLLAHLLTAPPRAIRRNEVLKLSVASGTITEAQAREARARITPHLYSSVGSTEASTFAFTALYTPEDRRWHNPVPDRDVQVVDEQDRPVPQGAVGRLRVSAKDGPCAYLCDDAASAAFFRQGFFYPGDLAVIRPDGRMALHGRVTEVINVMGHKIAPAPYEDHLREVLGVSGVCLFSVQNDSAEEQIHLAIEAPAPLDLTLMTDALRQHLQGFGVAHVHYLQALPRNQSGKVQRLAVQGLIAEAGRTAG